MGFTLRDLFFWRKHDVPQGPRGLDYALSRISVMEEVTGARLNEDGSVLIFVNRPVDEAFPAIVSVIQQHAPGLRGEVRRAGGAPATPPVLPSPTGFGSSPAVC